MWLHFLRDRSEVRSCALNTGGRLETFRFLRGREGMVEILSWFYYRVSNLCIRFWNLISVDTIIAVESRDKSPLASSGPKWPILDLEIPHEIAIAKEEELGRSKPQNATASSDTKERKICLRLTWASCQQTSWAGSFGHKSTHVVHNHFKISLGQLEQVFDSEILINQAIKMIWQCCFDRNA